MSDELNQTVRDGQSLLLSLDEMSTFGSHDIQLFETIEKISHYIIDKSKLDMKNELDHLSRLPVHSEIVSSPVPSGDPYSSATIQWSTEFRIVWRGLCSTGPSTTRGCTHRCLDTTKPPRFAVGWAHLIRLPEVCRLTVNCSLLCSRLLLRRTSRCGLIE